MPYTTSPRRPLGGGFMWFYMQRLTGICQACSSDNFMKRLSRSFKSTGYDMMFGDANKADQKTGWSNGVESGRAICKLNGDLAGGFSPYVHNMEPGLFFLKAYSQILFRNLKEEFSAFKDYEKHMSQQKNW